MNQRCSNLAQVWSDVLEEFNVLDPSLSVMCREHNFRAADRPDGNHRISFFLCTIA